MNVFFEVKFHAEENKYNVLRVNLKISEVLKFNLKFQNKISGQNSK